MDKVGTFLRSNVVILTCGTIFAAVHFVWYKMQFDTDFVPKKQQKEKIDLGWITFTDPKAVKKEESKEEKQ